MQPNRVHNVIAAICGRNVQITGSTNTDLTVRMYDRPDADTIREMVRELERDDRVAAAEPDFAESVIRVKLAAN